MPIYINENAADQVIAHDPLVGTGPNAFRASFLADMISLKPNGVDDTAALQACNGKSVMLGAGTFIVSSTLVFGTNTHIEGMGKGKTIIQLKANTNATLIHLHNADNSAIKNLTLDGNKANNTGTVTDTTTSVLLVDADSSYANSNLFMDIQDIVITNGQYNGLYLKATHSGSGYNWVFHLNNIHIMSCAAYGLNDETTDNCYSNFYISGCGKADMYLNYVANNKYVNFKCDDGGQINSGLTSQTDGANIIMQNVGNSQFLNLDSQSSYHVGIKMFSSPDNIINAFLSENGLAFNSGDPASDGTGIRFKGCYNVIATLGFYNGTNRQTTDIFFDTDCTDIAVNSVDYTPSKVVNSGTRCVVTNTKDLYLTKPTQTTSDLTYYVDTTNGNDTNAGTSSGTGAFKTINKAISMIPQIVNHKVTINVAAGSYGEYVTVSGFKGKGTLTINGASAVANAPNFTTNVFDINNCSVYTQVVGFNCTDGTNPFKFTDANVGIAECASTNTGTYGIYANRSKVSTYDCTMSNKSNGLYAVGTSFVASSTWVNSTGNTTGIYCSSSIVLKSGNQPAGTTAQSTTNGGFIN